MRLSPLTERSHARSDRTRALYATRCSVSSPCISVAEALRWLISVSTLWSVHPSSAVRFFIALNGRTFLRLDVRTSPDRGGLAEERRGVPGRPGVLNASAVRPVERSPRSMIRKTFSMALNYGAYGGMKSGSIPTESAETRTQEESWNVTLSNRGLSEDVREPSSVIRRIRCCSCMCLVYERNWGRQKNPLQLEQLMTCSFSTSSFVHSTDAISEDTHKRTDRLVRRKPHRLEKKTNPRPWTSYWSLSSRNAAILVPVEDARAWTRTLFSDCTLEFSAPHEQAGGKQSRPWWLLSSLFSSRTGDQRVVFYHWPHAVFENIGFWRGARILGCFRVPQPSESCCITDLKEECRPPCTFPSRVYSCR